MADLDKVDRAELLKTLKEISGVMTQAEAARDTIRTLKKDAKDEFGLAPKVFNRIVKAYHKGTFQEEQATFTEFETLYNQVVGSK